ncbi:MAG TPA: hypothetical protein DEA57_01305 [Sulfurihydrogenibium sp.]|uniref:hypothetical protein n=1 Tax=Sulfurihydrogenibium sp. (strain YO3AOP1) TaxID=436114 RepID=UPI0001725211|nr:hypothetical protein [Sulfurihydrogenibium sp. YO3AOP1]ACD65980.1 hypothetical protein SYO3AOP1_0335 [Sulfurihydrogenibium sp. YO3AOP1]HBT98112.1 hypothetical protein [Sulfurihydrogenibium sp.]
MKNLKFLIIVLFSALFLNSCSTTTFQPFYCENKFKEIKQKDNTIPDKFSFACSAMVSGLPALVKGEFRENEKMYISSPFGKNLLTIERKDGSLCVKASGFESCNSGEILSLISLYMPQAKPLTDITLLKSLISKKFNIQENEKYECDGNTLKIIRPEYTLVYEEGNLRKIIYKDYTVEYGLNNEIQLTNNGSVLMKLNISNLNFAK